MFVEEADIEISEGRAVTRNSGKEKPEKGISSMFLKSPSNFSLV